MDVLVKVSFLSMALTSPSKAELEEVWYKEVRISESINATVSEDFPTTSLSYCSMRFLNIIRVFHTLYKVGRNDIFGMKGKTAKTSTKRMHSSRMRTVRNSSRLLGGGGGAWSRGVVSQHALRQTPPRWTDRQV